MTEFEEKQLAQLMVKLYLNTQAAIAHFATEDYIMAELSAHDVKDLAITLIEKAQKLQEEEKDGK